MRYYQFKPILLEYRRDITSTNYGEKLVTVGKQQGVESLEEILSQLEAMDPTKNKQYVEWLARNFIAGKFRLEDSPRVRDDLQTFISVKNRLPTDERDLGKRDFTWLSKKANEINNVTIGGEDSDKGTFPVIKDIEVLSNTPLGLLAIPKTEEASRELGRGTKWCTAANKNNLFNSYNKNSRGSSLYIWRDKSGKKYQFHFDGEKTQFMDASNQPLTADVVTALWQHRVLGDLLKKNIDNTSLQFTPEKLKTPERCLSAAKESLSSLEFVPDRVKTFQFYTALINEGDPYDDPGENYYAEYLLKYVPDNLKTKELCLAVVKTETRHGDQLRFVPEKLKTTSLCLAAVMTNPVALKYVPERLKTPDLCDLAVKKSGLALQYVPERLKKPEMCVSAVKYYGLLLKDVPERLKTPEMCMTAIEKSYGRDVLKYVPERLKTPDLCDLAVKKSGLALQYVPERLKTPEMCMAAFDEAGARVLEFIPDEYSTPKMKYGKYFRSIENNEISLGQVPAKFKTPEICEMAVKRYGEDLMNVPNKHKTSKLCKIAVRSEGVALRYVPEKFKTYDLCLMAVSTAGSVLMYGGVPEKFKTFRMCLTALAQFPSEQLRDDIPEELKNKYPEIFENYYIEAIDYFYTYLFGAGNDYEPTHADIEESIRYYQEINS